MKQLVPLRRFIRLSSLAFVLVGVTAEFVLPRMSPDPLHLFEILFSGTAALICCCLPHEYHVRHLICCGSLIVISAIMRLIHLAPTLFVLIVSACLVAAYTMFVLAKNRQTRLFFCNTAVWHNIEDNERSILVDSALGEAMFFLVSLSCPCILQWIVTALSAVGFTLLYLYLYFGWYLLVRRPVRAEIRRSLRGRLQPVAPIRNEDEKRRMESLYRRIKDLMEDRQPYLDPEFSEAVMATMVFSNQNYLSRTVNTMSNLNFKQFLNSYRVQHAEELMRKDPRMQVKEIASLSGFNSTPSFNMAFKLFKGMTPGKYMKEMYQRESPTGHEHRPSLQEKEP